VFNGSIVELFNSMQSLTVPVMLSLSVPVMLSLSKHGLDPFDKLRVTRPCNS
jgi:hypothetical protein